MNPFRCTTENTDATISDSHTAVPQPNDPNELVPSLGRWNSRDDVNVALAFGQLDSWAEQALNAAGDVPWQWDILSGQIRFGDAPNLTLAALLQAIHPEDQESFLAALNRQFRDGSNAYSDDPTRRVRARHRSGGRSHGYRRAATVGSRSD